MLIWDINIIKTLSAF